MEDDINFWKMQDDLNFFKMKGDIIFFYKWMTTHFFENGRRPQLYAKWMTTSIFLKWKTTSIFWKWKTTSIALKIEDDLNIVVNRRWSPILKTNNATKSTYAIVKNSTAQLLLSTWLTHQPKKYWHNQENKSQINLNWLWHNSKLI